jgi:outer membrane protein assembly factor BamB
MSRPRSILLILAVVILTMADGFCPRAAWAADETSQTSAGWPQFRGPDGQGHVHGPIPTSWSDSASLWSVDIPGKGWSSPVILEGKVWMTTAVAAKSGDYSLRIVGVDEKSGKIRHDIELFTVVKPKPKTLHDRNSFASPTPVLAPGRLYAHFGCYGTACVDTVTGAILWKNETLIINHETGPASSPLLYKDRLICPYDGSDLQFAVALSTATGEVLWKAERPEAVAVAKQPDARRAFCTPLIINVAGKDQVVIPGAFCVYCYDPMTGREIWRLKIGGYSNVPRPLFAHGLVYVCTGFATPDLIAIRPDGEGDVTKTHVAWRHRKNVSNVPSPVIVGERLFMISDPGIATCLEAKTGKVLWSERLGGTYTASLLAAGNTVYAFEDSGKTILFEAADTFKELGRNELKGKVQATPAVDGGCLFVRTDQRLIKVGPK